MSAWWRRTAERLEQLTAKERVLVTFAFVLVIAMLHYDLALAPLARERATLTQRLAGGSERLAMLEQERAALTAAAALDPDAPVRARLAVVENAIAEAEQAIRAQAGQLVPPGEMPQILRSVLERTRGLGFVGLSGLGAEPLLPDAEDDAASPAANAYRHGFRIEFQGGWHAALSYLRALEQLPWHLFWTSVELRVEEHPASTFVLVVYTLSLDQRWIGV